MSLYNHLKVHKKWKQNPIERTLMQINTTYKLPPSTTKSQQNQDIIRFLKSCYGITQVVPVADIICNHFFLGVDKNGTKLFIKSGPHTGIYENEYRMGRALYDIDHEHFLEPLYYNDYDRFNFFANAYFPGITLKSAIMTGKLNDIQKSKIIGDIWRIFCALRQSDVVHRDVRPDNLMIVNGRLVLIDFQLAVSKTNYVELEYLAHRPNRLRKLGHKKFRYKAFTWDDSYSLLKVMEFIGKEKYYAKRYEIIYKHIKEYVGIDKVKTSVSENDFHRIVRHIKQMRI